MRFVCSNNESNVLDYAAEVIGLRRPDPRQYVDLADDRLITIARALGMEELPPSNEEAMQRLGVPSLAIIGDIPNVVNDPVTIQAAINRTEAAISADGDMPACIICGNPVHAKRHTTCSKECLKEKTRRYAKKYYHRKDQTTEVAGNETGPLSPMAAV